MKKKLYDPLSKYTPKMLDVLAQFGLGPKLEISGIERDILDVISQIEEPGFYDLCECFDLKPSKMEKYLLRLEDKGLVEYMDAAGKVYNTELAGRYIDSYRKETRSEKKFRAFIESLSDEELDNFMKLADRFKIDESLVSEEEPEDDDDNKFVIIDQTEAEYDEPECDETADIEPEGAEGTEVKEDEASDSGSKD